MGKLKFKERMSYNTFWDNFSEEHTSESVNEAWKAYDSGDPDFYKLLVKDQTKAKGYKSPKEEEPLFPDKEKFKTAIADYDKLIKRLEDKIKVASEMSDSELAKLTGYVKGRGVDKEGHKKAVISGYNMQIDNAKRQKKALLNNPKVELAKFFSSNVKQSKSISGMTDDEIINLLKAENEKRKKTGAKLIIISPESIQQFRKQNK